MADDPLSELRGGAMALPEVHEVEAWATPTFRVRNKMFATYAATGHHGEKRPSAWIKSTMMNQQLMVQMDPDRYFVPPYMGPAGWVGVYLDQGLDWMDVAELLVDGWKMVAGKKLLKQYPI